jgi:hypothetical protein
MGAKGMDRISPVVSRMYHTTGKKKIKEIMPDDGLVLLIDQYVLSDTCENFPALQRT